MMNSDSPKRLLLPPISNAAPGPLYRQIVEGIKREISEGRLQPGQSLPSFRSLAEQLMVSVITVKRAYEELEHEGILFRKQGLGTYISENGVARSREVKRSFAETLLKQGVEEALGAGMSQKEIKEMILKLIHQQGES